MVGALPQRHRPAEAGRAGAPGRRRRTGSEGGAVVRIRLSATIENEYAVRGVYGAGYEGGELPEAIRENKDGSRVYEVGPVLADSLRKDALFQIDPDGPFGD